jgi:Carboxypeptidase regulatory-like domain
MKRWLTIGTFFVLACACLSVQGQQGGLATITGSVSDSAGALIAGVRVSVKDTLTGHVTTVQTTSDGNYVVPFLVTGTYNIFAVSKGFQTQTQTGVILTPDQVASVNFVLKVGAATTEVEVVATGTQIDTSTGAVADVINEKAISELPLDGRNPAELVYVAPGGINGAFTTAIQLPGSGSGFPQETAASVNGSRLGGVTYQLDGVINMNNYLQTANPFPNPDATQEFRVITNNFDAQYGYSSGTIVSVSTRSGTNQWHGGVFEFLRNNVLNATDYFTHVADPLKRNQFGGSIGGPIVKNKLFIFGNAQITRERIDVASSGSQVPNNNELAGDFSQFCTVVNNGTFDANGVCRDAQGNVSPGQLYQSAFNRTLANIYPNNQINPNAFVPFSVNFENGIPKTNDPIGNIILQGQAQINDGYEYTIRSDYNLSPKQTLSGRIYYDNFNNPPFSGNGNYLVSNRSAQAQLVNVSVNHTWAINPTMVNDLRVGFNRNNSQSVAGIVQPDGKPISDSILGANLPSETNTIGLVATNGMWISQIPVNQGRHNWIIEDTVSVTKGRHSIMAGASAFTVYSLENALWEADPLAIFNGSVTGDADADFLLGDIGEFLAGGGEYNQYHSLSWAAFGQDSIKIKPNLNINLGLRWEPQIAPRAADNNIAEYVPGEQSTRFPNAPTGLVYAGDPGVPPGGYKDEWGVFLPRLSVAWSPKALPNTSIRSAFGYMVPLQHFEMYNSMGDTAPFGGQQILYFNTVTPGCTLNIMQPFACYAPTNGADPYPPFSGPGFKPPSDSPIITPANVLTWDPHYKTGREEAWNLTIEHTIGNDLLFGVSYIGRHDFHLTIPEQLNPGIFYCGPVGPNCTQAQYNLNGTRPLANFDEINDHDSAGVSSYNAFQVSVNKRFSHGFQFISNFSYSKAVDTSSVMTFTTVTSVYNPFNFRADHGISDLNIPRIWNNTFVYQTPKLDSLGKVGSSILGRWEISGIWSLHSGLPFPVYGGDDPAIPGAGSDNDSFSLVGGDRADFVPGQSLQVYKRSPVYSSGTATIQYFNTNAFTYNAIGTFGDSGKNVMAGPGYNNADLMFGKNFLFRERYALQFRWEMFNAFNRTEFAVPNNTVGQSTFGLITSDTGSPRVMQAGLKLNF